eukprot:gene6677-17770_t
MVARFAGTDVCEWSGEGQGARARTPHMSRHIGRSGSQTRIMQAALPAPQRATAPPGRMSAAGDVPAAAPSVPPDWRVIYAATSYDAAVWDAELHALRRGLIPSTMPWPKKFTEDDLRALPGQPASSPEDTRPKGYCKRDMSGASDQAQLEAVKYIGAWLATLPEAIVADLWSVGNGALPPAAQSFLQRMETKQHELLCHNPDHAPQENDTDGCPECDAETQVLVCLALLNTTNVTTRLKIGSGPDLDAAFPERTQPQSWDAALDATPPHSSGRMRPADPMPRVPEPQVPGAQSLARTARFPDAWRWECDVVRPPRPLRLCDDVNLAAEDAYIGFTGTPELTAIGVPPRLASQCNQWFAGVCRQGSKCPRDHVYAPFQLALRSGPWAPLAVEPLHFERFVARNVDRGPGLFRSAAHLASIGICLRWAENGVCGGECPFFHEDRMSDLGLTHSDIVALRQYAYEEGWRTELLRATKQEQHLALLRGGGRQGGGASAMVSPRARARMVSPRARAR